MRPSQSVAGAALTAALALGALPGIAGSQGLTPASVIDPSAFQSISVSAFTSAPATAGSLDAGWMSASRLAATTVLIEPGSEPARVVQRPQIGQPAPHGGSALKPPRYTMTGWATYYANGTTAMRLPRGTTVIVCGSGGCLERIVNDYGPVASLKDRIVDLYTPDFFAVCGCPSWAGTTWVTVSVY